MKYCGVKYPRHCGKPYVRRGNGRERSHRPAVESRMKQLRPGKYYVLVKRGFPNLALRCGATKHEALHGERSQSHAIQTLGFRGWCRRVKLYEQSRMVRPFDYEAKKVWPKKRGRRDGLPRWPM